MGEFSMSTYQQGVTFLAPYRIGTSLKDLRTNLKTKPGPEFLTKKFIKFKF